MYDDDAGRLKRFLNTFPLWIFLPFDTLSSKNFFYFIFFFFFHYTPWLIIHTALGVSSSGTTRVEWV